MVFDFERQEKKRKSMNRNFNLLENLTLDNKPKFKFFKSYFSDVQGMYFLGLKSTARFLDRPELLEILENYSGLVREHDLRLRL